MPRQLLKIDRIESWEGRFNQAPVWIVKGWTVEDLPYLMTVRTNKSLQASACERALKTGRAIWISWKDGRFGARDVVSAELDEREFNMREQEELIP